MSKINKHTTISELIQLEPSLTTVLMRLGMYCTGCPSAAGETLEQAAAAHGLNADLLRDQINDYLSMMD